MYAWRAKIGLISRMGENMEHAFHIYAPKGVSVCSTKIAGAERETLLEELSAAASLFRGYDTDVIAVGAELGTAAGVPDFDSRCRELLSLASGEKRVVTGGDAVVEAFRALGCRRVAVLSPYTDGENAAVCALLRAGGMEPVRSGRLDMIEFQTNHLPFEDADRDFLYKSARAFDPGDAEALFLCGECLSTMEIIEYLERDLGLPVVTSQQALFWRALRAARVNAKPAGLGRLFLI